MPWTNGDTRQWLIALGTAVASVLIPALGPLVGVSVWEVDWTDIGKGMVDNIVQGALTYALAWYGLKGFRIVRTQQVTPASEVVPASEPVIEQIRPPDSP